MSINLNSIWQRSQVREIEIGDWMIATNGTEGIVQGWTRQADGSWMVGLYVSRLNRIVWKFNTELAFADVYSSEAVAS